MSRASILSILSNRVGFPFEESELSPTLRRQMTDLVSLKQSLDGAGFIVDDLVRREGNLWVYTIISFLAGVVLILAGFSNASLILAGIIALAVGAVLYYGTLKPVEQTLAGKRKDLAVVAVAFDSQVAKMAEEIFQQLSEAHEARVRPKMEHVIVDFARILEAARGRGIILDTIECPSCKASISLPGSGDTFQCEYCGKTIRATDIFEKLKIPLRQTA